MIVEKKISELEIGHYVLAIIQQKGTFSLNKPGHIKSQAVIDHFNNKGVISLSIDTSKTLKSNEKITTTPLSKVNKTANLAHKVPLVAQITKAREIFNQSKDIQRNIFNNALNGENIDLTPVKEVTEHIIEAIFDNPDALACVINIRIKDEYLLEHSVSVSILTTIFSRFLKMDKKIVEQVAIGAFLHDVGKIMVPDEILNKPAKLTPHEFGIMKGHASHSIEIISATPGISELSLEVAALHHEKLNGQGYPYQLKADEISQYGRMISICDIFDALTADRVYKEGYCHIKAFNILQKLASDNHLDQTLVNQFIKCMGVYPVGSLVELNSNKLAIVEGRNQENPVNPKVRSFYSVEHHHYVMAEDIDLSLEKDFIVKGVRANDFNLDMNKIVEFLMMQG